MKNTLFLLFALCLLCGCNTLQTVSPDRLPVWGTAPLKNTVYLGSDEQFHFFQASRISLLKASPEQYRIPRAEATILPAEWDREVEARQSFVESVNGKEIKLLQLVKAE